MNSILGFVVSVFLAIPVTIMVGLLSFFSFDQPFWLSAAYALASGISTYGLMSFYRKSRFLKKHGLSRKEYRYISQNLDEAKQKIYRLHKAFLSIRDIPSFKQRIELSRMTRKIYGLTKKEPNRFYQAESFYFYHLDSAVELTEKYAFLSVQPKKSPEVVQALQQTRRTLEELGQLMTEDLYQLLSDDIDQLQLEIDVAKHAIQEQKETRLTRKAGD